MDKFFKEAFLESPAFFTIFGTKPMSGFTIANPSEEEWITVAKQHLSNLPKRKQEKMIKEMRSYCRNYDLHLNWERWIEWKKQFSHTQILFLKRPTDQDDLFNVDLLNVKEALWTLEKYHDLFQKELAMDFDPIQVVFEFENRESTFWNKVFENHYLLGILYGFGEKNAYLFSKEVKGTTRLFLSKLTESKGKKNLKLPAFRSYEPFSNQDPVLKKYGKERKKIEGYLKNKNFVDAVLEKIICPEDG